MTALGRRPVLGQTMTPAQDPKQKNLVFPIMFWDFLAKTTIFEVSRSSRVDWYQNFWIPSLPDPFRHENVVFDWQLTLKAP